MMCRQGMYGHLLSFPVYAVVFGCLMPGSKNSGKKNRGNKGHQPGKVPGRARGGGACNCGGGTLFHGYPPVCLHLCDQKQQLAMRAQISNIWRVGSFLPILAPTSCVQAALGTYAKLPATGLGMGDG